MAREEPTTETESPTDEQRRDFLKGAAATGVAAIGLGAFSGGAAAQSVRNLNLGDVTVVDNTGDSTIASLLEIEVKNINILNNLDFEDIIVTVIGGDVNVLTFENSPVTVNFGDSLIEVEVEDNNVEILNDSLNDNNVLVNVAVLSDTGDVLAAGDTIA